jgi:hypothetical protein
MEGLRADSEAARFIAEGLREERFTLIDVGCSGGIDPGWNVLGASLRAIGFDISVPAIENLRRANAAPNHEYVAGRVAPSPERRDALAIGAAQLQSRNPWERFAIHRTQTLRDDPNAPRRDWAIATGPVPNEPPIPIALEDFVAGINNVAGAAESELRDNLWFRTQLEMGEVHLPQFLQDRGLSDIDFIKLDVDGPDYGILESLSPILSSAQVLGVGLEVNFIGTAAPDQHTFHNTDRFMRRHGFELFGLTVRNYSSAALPFMYALPHPFGGVSTQGRPFQGDALYVRDFGFKDAARLAAGLSDEKLLKLSALFAVTGLGDQAAEVLLQFRARLSALIDIERALDLLTREVQDSHYERQISTLRERERSYADYIADFERGSPRHYGAAERRYAWEEGLCTKAARVDALEAELAATQTQLERIQRSRSWKWAQALSKAGRLWRGR